MPHKALSLLGIAHRAGKLSLHEGSNLAAIRSGRAKLLLLAKDAGASTAKKYLDKCATYQVPVYREADRMELGVALGTAGRSAVAVLDEGFAKKLLELLT